jgi:DNA processing protein
MYVWMVEEKIYQIALSLLAGIGPIKAKTMATHCGGAEAVFKESLKALGAIEGIGAIRVKNMDRNFALKRAEEEFVFMEHSGVKMHYYQDANYPSKLKFCEDGPVVLFSKGDINFEKQNVAVVGTRKATSYGKELTQKLIADLVQLDVQIISGLAHGIDKEAHEAALKNNLTTIAVMGHGLEYVYPAAHKGLADRIMQNGGLISEFISYTPGDPSNFPKRNRIVAGLADATVVVESTQTGGSMITANLANDYNRDVFAFPGNVNQASSSGCNNLIRRDKAHLITCADDMLEILGLELDESSGAIQTSLFNDIGGPELEIINLLKAKKVISIDDISYQMKMTSSELSLYLFNL